jgi:glutathione S-transferase
MSALILHHYPLSPYSEKTRLAMGVKGLSWNSVEIPIWTPRPKLTPMTGGYRRTPILQIGADFYCDTLLILRVLERSSSVGNLYPSGQEGLAKAFGWWIEKGSFQNAVCLTVSNLGGKLPQELVDERAKFFPFSIDPADVLPERAKYLQRFNAHIAWLAEVLGDGRKFMLGAAPSAADLAAYHPIWFAHSNGGSEITEMLSFSTIVGPWYDRVAHIGHGSPSAMTPDQAIEVARVAEPGDPDDWLSEGQNVGLKRGDWVSVTPDDYGNPVVGRLLAWQTDEIVIRHEDPSVGRVNLHFPRVGFDVLPQQRMAA